MSAPLLRLALAALCVLACCDQALARIDGRQWQDKPEWGESTNATKKDLPEIAEFQDNYHGLKSSIEQEIGEFDFHVRLTGFYQWHDYARIAGVPYSSLDGAGFILDFWANWYPVEGGQFYVKFRYGKGRAGNRQLNQDGATLAYMNELSVDVPRNHLRLYNIYYKQEFLDNDLFVAVGQVDPEVYIDVNRYANSEYTQFMSQPLVADPVLDNEDTHAPMVAMGGNPLKDVTLTGYVGSNTDGGDKGVWDDPWEGPFVGLQAEYDTDIGGQKGTYRLVGWSATYPHKRLSGSGTAPGYSVGVNFDQDVTEDIGVFGRAYWHNDVYNMPWAFSTGVALTGLVPERDKDVLGLGVAAIVADDVVHTGGVETHLEAYYRFILGDHVSFTPDISYIVQPQGNGNNDNILAFLLRLDIQF